MLIQAAEELIPGTSTNVFLPDEETGTLRAATGYIATHYSNENVSLKSGEGLGGWVFEHRKAVYLTDPASDPRWVGKPWNKENNIGAFAVIPLVVGDEVHGILNCFREERREWTQEEMDLLDTFASQVAVAIRNAQLLDEIRENNRELENTLSELEQTQSQLVESEKMASLGGLVAGIAHEINTPVGISVTAASHLQDRTRELESCFQEGRIKRSDLESYVNSSSRAAKIILENLHRAAGLIGSFKKVAVDQSSEERRSFNLGEYLHEILVSLRPKLKKTKIKVSVDCDKSLVVDSYPGPLAQIVTNFVMNSVTHAFDQGEEGEISISAHHNGKGVNFRYADNGKGMSEENRKKIFDPFFTTKRGEGGSGLGMHIVYNLITQTLGGTVKCNSEPGKGTEFVVTIPMDSGQDEKENRPAAVSSEIGA
jgi:signal transduction histidine kinase